MYCVPRIDVCNYADDNSFGVIAESVENMLSNLSAACNSMYLYRGMPTTSCKLTRINSS